MINKTKCLIINGLLVRLTRKRMKNLRLSISRPEGEIRLSAPYFASANEIAGFVNENRQWIQREQAKVYSFERRRPLQWRDGDRLRYFDKSLTVRHVESLQKRISICVLEDAHIFEVRVPRCVKISDEQRVQSIGRSAEKFLRRELLKKASKLVEEWRAVFGVDVNEVRIKKMKTRWGTCNIPEKRIWLSLSLASFPSICLEYVVVHELVHLIERNHTKRFWAIIDSAFAHRVEAEKILSENLEAC